LRRTFHIIFGSGSPVQRRLFIALTAVTICSVAVAIWTDCQPRYIQGEPGATARSYANLREKLILASGSDGLFIRFIGFETGDATMNRIYNYAVYAMYPKRVLVGDPSLLANGPEEITAVNKPRDDSWLREHHIGSVLTVKRTVGEPELGSVHWVASTQHPENDPTAAIAESAHGFPCAAFLLCCLIVGYAIISTLGGDQPLLEQIGYAAVLGPGVLGLILIYLSMGGVLPSRTGILCCTLPFLILDAALSGDGVGRLFHLATEGESARHPAAATAAELFHHRLSELHASAISDSGPDDVRGCACDGRGIRSACQRARYSAVWRIERGGVLCDPPEERHAPGAGCHGTADEPGNNVSLGGCRHR
jgi:hypothetical protein